MPDQQDISRHSENAAHRAAVKEKAERPLDALRALSWLLCNCEFSKKAWLEIEMRYELYSSLNAGRIHGSAGLTNQPETPTPLDGASC
jgi:hypothetical protein